MRSYVTPVLAIACTTIGWAQSDHNANINIFTDNPSSLFRVQGTALHATTAVERARTGLHSIRVLMESGKTIEFHHTWGGNDAQGISHVEFWLHPGSLSGTSLSLSILRLPGQWSPAVPITNFATIAPNTWTRVSVPLSALDSANATSIFTIRLTGLNQGQRTLWFDDVRLVKPAPASHASITINAANPIRTVSKRMFGVGTFFWDHHNLTQETRNLLIEGGVATLNFPGGTAAHVFDWQTNSNRLTGAVGQVTTVDFINIANSIGAEKIININYGTGTPEEAAAWVLHANVVNNGNVKHWGVGNEPYMAMIDHHPHPNDALTYAEFVRDCVNLMKAIDPTIKIGVGVTWSPTSYPQRVSVQNLRTGQMQNGWTAVLLARLRELNVRPDYFDIKFYPNTPGTESDHFTLQIDKRWDFLVPFMRQTFRDFYGNDADDIPIFMLEHNNSWGSPGKQGVSIVNAIFLLDSWGRFALHGGEAFVWWNLRNSGGGGGNFSPTLYGWRNYEEYGMLASGLPAGVSDPLNTPHPTFYAFKQLKNFIRPGDTLVTASSNNELVTVYASRAAGSNKLRVLLLNKSHDTSTTANISMSGYQASASPTVHRYSTVEDEGRLDVRTFTHFSPGISRTTNQLSIALPHYSITVIEF